MKPKKPFKINGQPFARGETGMVFVEIGHLYDFTEMNIPVEVIRGVNDGPILFLSGAIHGDEINGVEIIRQVTEKIDPKKLSGTVLAVPVVNVFGFNSRSRYLPDRRDLNRSFPGTPNGSLASQMARTFMREIVLKSTHGIDFHTGAIHRFNAPQIRACLEDDATKKMARAFNAEAMINSALRDGSLREAARKRGIPMLLFEGGEALRFDEKVIQVGVRGTLSVMRHLGMLSPKKPKVEVKKSVMVDQSFWVRAPHGGSMRAIKKTGDLVEEGETLALILDLFGKARLEVTSPSRGIVIGRTRLPLINKGDALFHVATSKRLRQ